MFKETAKGQTHYFTDIELNELKIKIGLLRQWLNEDRIDDTNKMVTNEQIESWLLN